MMTIKGNYRQITPKLAKACKFKRRFENDYPAGELSNSDNLNQNYAMPQIVFWIWFLGSVMGWCLICSDTIQAQIIPDDSLETQVNVADNVTEISGGTSSGSTLFHSFQDFSVATGNTAFFNNAADISNIVSRVTGSNTSNIDGLIRANGNANLILLNPNGINFGANASLDIGGSFLGSTADQVMFEDGTVFSAKDTQAEPMLTISVPVSLQLGQNSGAIQVTGTGNISFDVEENPGLAVTPRNTFALVGNNITFNGGVVTAESGRIELGSVAKGEVSISEVTAGWQLGYEAVTELANLQLLAASSLGNPNLVNNPDGGIQVQGKNITLKRSQISAPTLADSPGAGININASESLSLHGEIQDGTISGSRILNEVSPEASGKGGAINIETGSLNISDRSFISNTTFGAGDGGNVNILASDINITGTGFAEFQQTFQLAPLSGALQPEDRGTGIFIGTTANGQAGTLSINTNSLKLNEGAIIFSPVFSSGIGGDLNFQAADIELNASTMQSGAVIESNTRGSLGDINIETKRLNVRNGATVINVTLGDAAGGDVNITADESIELIDSPIDTIVLTGIYTNTNQGLGTGGDVNINTGKLKVEDAVIGSNTGALVPPEGIITVGGLGGNINIQADDSIEVGGIPANPIFDSGIGSTTYSPFDAGNVTISTDKLIIRDGADFATATVGAGDGGTLTINANQSIELIGTTNPNGMNQGGLFATSGRANFPDVKATGASGDIAVNTGKLIVRDGATINVQSLATGDSGNLDIVADSILLDNQGNLSAGTQSGVGGNIEIKSNTLKIDRGLINASVSGSGTGGNIEIEARDSLEVNASGFESLLETFDDLRFLTPESATIIDPSGIIQGIIAVTFGEGNAGNIALQTSNLQLNDGAFVGTATLGNGAAGSMKIDASATLTVDASVITASTIFTGPGGNVDIDTGSLEVLAGGQVIASTLGSGNGGNLTIDSTDSITVEGELANNLLLANTARETQPLTINGENEANSTVTPNRQLNITNESAISVASSGTGDAGTLKLDTDLISLDRQGTISAATQSGEGGDIVLNAENFILRNGSTTTATAAESGNGGNIIINADNVVVLEGSQIIADAFRGVGGNIQIDTQGLFVCEKCQISASSRLGIDGQVNIETLQPDPQLEIVDIPQQPAQAKEEVAVACPREGISNTSELTLTGRGGLPPRPQEPLSGESIIAFDTSVDGVKQSTNSTTKSLATLPPPARGWYRTPQGRVVLTAQVSGTVDKNSSLDALDCHAQ